MKPSFRSRLAMSALIVASVPAVRAADAAPAMQRGDTWTYRRAVSRDGQPDATDRLRYSAVRQVAGGRWIVAVGADDEAPRTIQLMKGFVDGNGCLVDIVETRTLQPAPCTTGLHAGDHWSMTLEDGRTREVRVLEGETIRVPAGSFETVKLEVEERPAAGADGLDGANRLSTLALLWIAPALGVPVRAERESRRRDGSLLDHGVETLESSRHGALGPVPTNRIPPPEYHGSHAARLMLSRDCQPNYPPQAVRAGATGMSKVRLAIDADGLVTDSELIGASGATPEHRLLDATAQGSIATCRFRPATTAAGAAVAATVDVLYRWRIE